VEEAEARGTYVTTISFYTLLLKAL